MLLIRVVYDTEFDEILFRIHYIRFVLFLSYNFMQKKKQ
jgi:hypothetical protein